MAERFAPIDNPAEQVRQQLLAIQRRDETLQQNGGIDPQEEAERRDAATRYLGESESHFVDYVEESVRTSAESGRRIREIQQECFRVYQEEDPPNYSLKEDWQSKVIIPKPHSAVQFAMAAVKQAFNPNFLTVEDKRNPKLAQFWRRLFEVQYDRQHAKFVKRFTVASGMGFATGQSFEFIPVWRPGQGLDFSLVEPWKIHRDPDALSQESQSGMYWIHEEYQDLWFLNEAERQGRYVNTRNLVQADHQEQNPQNFQMDRQRQADLRQQIWTRNRFRTSLLTREYWGTVLDSRGELLHPGMTVTIAGSRVIGEPRPSPYRTLRWPGVSYSPLPNFLRFDGRSLLQSVRSLWYYMCNLQALHIDYLNWQVNPMREVMVQGLVDQDDIDPFPGKIYATRATTSGQQVVRTVDHRSTTNEVLANSQHADRTFQHGTFVSDPIQGLPGFRQQITARESAQNLQQALTVFSVIGENLDVGAVDITNAAMETIMLNITRQEIVEIFDIEELLDVFGESQDPIMMRVMADIGHLGPIPAIFVPTPDEIMRVLGEIPADIPMSETGVILPPIRGTFRITGLQSLLKDAATMNGLREVILPMTVNPFFQPYLRPHKIAKAIEQRSNLTDEELLVSQEEAEQIDQQQRESQAQISQMQLESFQRQQELEEARMQLEMRKAELDEAKLMLEAEKIQLEAQKMAIEAERQQAELEGDIATKQLELQQQEAEIARIAAEIAQKEHELFVDLLKTEADLRKTEAQIEKTETQTRLQERKMRMEERVARASIAQMQASDDEGGGNDGDD